MIRIKGQVGIVAFSFGLSKMEVLKMASNPCNLRIAEEVVRIANKEAREGKKVLIVVQWEISLALEALLDRHHDLIVIPKKGEYLDANSVMDEAEKLFHQEGGAEYVIPVTQPFLLLHKCKQLVSESGFPLKNYNIGRIGFDRNSLQPWTRGPIPLFLYACRQVLFGHKGQ